MDRSGHAEHPRLLVFVGAIASLFMRYRTAPDREQEQIRWVLLAGSVVGIISLGPYILRALGVLPPPGPDTTVLTMLSTMSIVLLPASIVVAVMEPPWIDVDIVIRRSVVYGALPRHPAHLHRRVRRGRGSGGGTAGTQRRAGGVLTVVIAILFQPPSPDPVGRRPLGVRCAPDQVRSSDRLRCDDRAGDRAPPSSSLAGREPSRIALRLTWVTVSLDDGSQASAGSVVGEPVLRVPLGVGDEQVGEIVFGPKAEGRLGDDDIQLVRTLAGQLSWRSNAPTRGSRRQRRRVGAAPDRTEHPRRRPAGAGRPGRQAGDGPIGSCSGGPESGRDRRSSPRRPADHVGPERAVPGHPSVGAQRRGIAEAVEDRCSRLPLEVTLETSDGLRARRFGDNIEGAAYFFVTESLANVLKHAGATRATVSLAYDDGRLQLGVADDGRGFDPDETSDGGLAGLRDRIRALGGTFTSPAGPAMGPASRRHSRWAGREGRHRRRSLPGA